MQLWESLTLLQRVLLVLALPFSLFMGFQFMSSLFGRASFVEYSDVDPNSGAHDDGALDRGIRGRGGLMGLLRIVSAFFAVGCWTALAVSMYTGSVLSVLAGVGGGALAVGMMLLLIRLAEKMKVYGKIEPEKAVGHSAEVTIHVPPRRLAAGQVTLELNGKSYDVDAVSDGDVFITLGTRVRVVGVSEDRVIVVPEKEVPTAGQDK